MWQFSRNSHQIFAHINANESLKWNECSILMFYQRMEIIEIANHLSLQFAYIETYILRWNILPMVKFCLRLYKSHFLSILNKLNGAEGRNLAFNLKLLICQFECGLNQTVWHVSVVLYLVTRLRKCAWAVRNGKGLWKMRFQNYHCRKYCGFKFVLEHAK